MKPYGPYKKRFTWFAIRHRLLENRGPCPSCGSKTMMKNSIQRRKQRFVCRSCLKWCYEDRLKPIKSEAAVIMESRSIAVPENMADEALRQDLADFDRAAEAQYNVYVAEYGDLG